MLGEKALWLREEGKTRKFALLVFKNRSASPQVAADLAEKIHSWTASCDFTPRK
jgi:hypothetical protein